ncbi:hypothetical protein [Mesoterricola sediminis]|uniref:Uncharacterized protein n=1 Tax=Mesoterricola sediminis TaxID=2927980 RepID=A0AA48H5F2_9BACT|nr:hypothetical protein [Mesoterricola sediminis]BDU76303.1 hypothetical protein METESE_12610 [Mesoterricola sediminis]
MDLSLFKVKDSLWVDIIHPELDGDLSFELAGPSHPRTLQAQRDFQDRLAKGRRKRLDADELTAIGNEALAARILSWKGLEWEGKPLECNQENAIKILGSKNLAFIADQISRALGDNDSFFGK